MTPAQKEAERCACVMLAFSRGEAIERSGDAGTTWIAVRIPGWNWDAFDYRVKRTPIELSMAYSQNEFGEITSHCSHCNFPADLADKMPRDGSVTIVFREVTDGS